MYKQIIDKTDNQSIIPFAVQPRLDPNGGLTENENGLAVKSDFIEIDLKDQIYEDTEFTKKVTVASGSIKAYVRKNIVTIETNGLKMTNQRVLMYAVKGTDVGLPKAICWNANVSMSSGILKGQALINKNSNTVFLRCLETDTFGYSSLTYQC